MLARRRLRLQAISALAFVFVLFLFWKMHISSVSVSTNASSRLTSDQKESYQSGVLKLARASTVAGQSWLLDEASLDKALVAKYPEVQRITVSTSLFSSTVKADIRFRKAVFIWRDASGQDQFVDENGVLFKENLDPTVDLKKLIRIEDQSGVVLKAGTSVLTGQLVQFVGQLHTKIPSVYGANATIARIIIPKSTREVQVQVSGQSYLIKFSSVRSLDEQVNDLRSLLTLFKSSNAAPSQYIDLRVSRKAFYK
jgi:hypothetical protein